MLRQADVIRYQVLAELRAEMDRAYFGLIWWVAEPILYMAVFYVVFSVLFQRGDADFVPFLLCGLVAWRWFDASVRNGSNAILSNGSLMNQVYLPKLIFPVVTVLANSIKFLIILVLLLAFLMVYGIEPTVTWLALPVLIAVQFLVVLVASSFLALLVPFFPDLNILITNAMTMLLFLSGVFFSFKDMSGTMQLMFYGNPMAILIEAYRNVLIDGLWPHWGALAGVVVASLIFGLVVLYLARRFDRLYPKLVM